MVEPAACDRQAFPDLTAVVARAMLAADNRQYPGDVADAWEDLDPVQRGAFENMADDVLHALACAGYSLVPKTTS